VCAYSGYNLQSLPRKSVSQIWLQNVIWKSIPLLGATSPISITESLPDIPEPLRLIRMVRRIRPRPGHGRSSFFPIPLSVLPPDQTHVHKSEDHAGDGEADFDAGAAGVAGTFGGGEEVAGADAGWLLVGVREGRFGGMGWTYATAWARATARGTATARRDSLPALLADQVTIRGVQTVYNGQMGVRQIGKLGCWR
jgi:hypothetical protein